jgi:hypothetical protein
VPSYAPCPCQGICIACSLLLALLRCHLRVSGMFSRYQQPVLAGGALLTLPFAFHHYTYLIDGADPPLRHNVHKKSIWLSVQRNKRDGTVTPSMCGDERHPRIRSRRRRNAGLSSLPTRHDPRFETVFCPDRERPQGRRIAGPMPRGERYGNAADLNVDAMIGSVSHQIWETKLPAEDSRWHPG